jgi:penicillin-binding protein 1A
VSEQDDEKAPETGTETQSGAPPRRRRSAWIGLAVFLTGTVIVYGAAGWAGVHAGELLMADQPSVRELQEHDFALTSRVHAADGTEIYSFAAEKRDYASYEEINPWVIEGLIATEDEQFWEHRGLNWQGIARAALHDAKLSIEKGRIVLAQGGSSITQQLAKQLYLSPEKKLERKIKEALLAIQIEKNFRKEEILEMYLNQVFLGHRRHGVEAASQYYFGKSAGQVNLPEAALLAGLPQAPSRYSPRNNVPAATARRNHVLDRMATVGYITQEEADEAKATPIQLETSERERRIRTQQAAPYFVEEIRRELVGELGDAVNTGGLEIETTLRMDVQRAATRAVRDGLRALDQRVHGFRPIELNVLDDPELAAEGVTPETYEHPLWLVEPEVDGVIPGVVLASGDDRAVVRIGERELQLEREAIAWTKKKRISEVLRRGDIAPFKIAVDEDSGDWSVVQLEQDPPFEAALVAIDVASGEILAMVGGYDYSRSEFNKVTQARRQVGSAFKPIYFAAALEEGLSPGTGVMDEPTVFLMPWTGEDYRPENYYVRYYGRVTMRETMERSLNIASVRLMNFVGYDKTIDLAREMGVTGDLRPFPSMALGAFESTLLEMTSAYSVFPNGGLRVAPRLLRSVRDPKGNLIYEPNPRVREVISPEAAFQMTQILRGVVQAPHGTARRARELGRPVAGKTGTTDEYSDAWFVGFTPSMAVGVWVGYEKDKKSLCKKCAGGSTALPIWVDFVDQVLGDSPVEQFEAPGGIDFVAVDRQTGLRASLSCPKDQVFLEALRSDQPLPPTCTDAHHQRLRLPQCLQRFPLDVNGVLVVDSEELLFQLEEEATGCTIIVDPIQRQVVMPMLRTGEGPLTLPYRLQQEVYFPDLAQESVEELMEHDPRALRRGVLRDFDVLDGRTVVVVRNEDSKYK